MAHRASALLLLTIPMFSPTLGASPSWSASRHPICRSPCWCRARPHRWALSSPIIASFPFRVLLPPGKQSFTLMTIIFLFPGVNGIKVNRPGRNGTYIYFRDATLNNSVALKFDCGWSPNVIYSGSTILIDTAPFVWTPGHFYYVTLDSGRHPLLVNRSTHSPFSS